MIELDKPIPAYLNEKANIVRLIIFTSLFALVFINIYEPFGADKWYNVTSLQFFTYSSLTILTGVLVVVVSRMIMYRTNKRTVIKLWHYLFWIFCEILAMSLFYALFQKIVLEVPRVFLELVKSSSRYTALVLLLPYSTLWLYFSWRDKKEQIERMEEFHGISPNAKDMIPFYDDRGTLRFSVKKERLLYLESAENYISIFYLNKGKVAKHLLRDTLKKVEEGFSGTDVVRCHRSYMVNFEKVKVIRKERDGLKLELDTPSISDIPVSRTYVKAVMQTFSKYYQMNDLSS
jgi:hypothetical protein